MMKLRLTFAIIAIVILAVLTWAPWMDEQKIITDTYFQRANMDGTAKAQCGYTAVTVPLGRWITSCESGYYITFWGKRL